MPLYEYECGACAHLFEEFQKITDKPVRTCPECGKRRVRRLISCTSFVLKGSGWYVTDYGRKDAAGKGGGNKAGSPSEKESPKKQDDKASAPTSTSS